MDLAADAGIYECDKRGAGMKNLMPAIRGRRICKGKFGVLLFLTDLHYKKIDKERLCMYNNHKIVLNKFYLTFIAVRQENPTKLHTCTERLEK